MYAQLFQDFCDDDTLLKLFEGQKLNDLFHSDTTFNDDDRKVLIEFKESKQLSLNDHGLNMTRGCMFVHNKHLVGNTH